MKLKPSIHYNDACIQVANCNRASGAARHVLNLGARKWDIKKTLVYVMPNGLHYPVWIDSEGKYVYRILSARAAGDYPVIGELEYVNEPIEFE